MYHLHITYHEFPEPNLWGFRFFFFWCFQLSNLSCCCSVTKLCPTLCDPSMSGFPVLHYLPDSEEFAQTHVHWVSDAIQTSHPLSPPSPPALNLFQHQDLFQWVFSNLPTWLLWASPKNVNSFKARTCHLHLEHFPLFLPSFVIRCLTW